MLTLLRRANNDDCSVIPPWNMPTMKRLAAETGVGDRRLRRLVAHLCAHGWLEYRPGPGRQSAKARGEARCVFSPLPRPPEPCVPPCEGIHPNAHKSRPAKRVPGPAINTDKQVQGPGIERVPPSKFSQADSGISPRDRRDKGEVKGMAAEPEAVPLTVTIAGRVHPAEVCQGCGELVPSRFTYNRLHMMCEPEPVESAKPIGVAA